MSPTEEHPTSDQKDDHGDFRRPANENPWYCLSTLHGEQPGDGFDQSLAEQNRDAWNAWQDPQRSLDDLAQDFRQRTEGRFRLPNRADYPDFSNVEFDRPVVFDGFNFARATSFRNAIFHRRARFMSAGSQREIDFSSACFEDGADFTNAHFHGLLGANFGSANFLAGADFSNARLAQASFSKTTFASYVLFTHAQFDGAPDFMDATFQEGGVFISATFNGPITFTKASFQGMANFSEATFKHYALFESVTFADRAIFDNVKFGGRTIFANASFNGYVPDFRGASMHEATEWHDVAWPKSPPKRSEAQEHVYAYERLKQEMERLKKHEDELSFFRRELRARRNIMPVFSAAWLLNFAYEATSAYGYSVVRPLLWLIALFATGVAIFSCLSSSCSSKPMTIELAAKLSFANLFVFLPDKREMTSNGGPLELSCFGETLHLVGTVQTLIGTILLFLIGLAVRNHLRMR